MDDALKTYIEDARKSGMDDAAIKASLASSGWSAASIDEAFGVPHGPATTPFGVLEPHPPAAMRGPDIVADPPASRLRLLALAGPFIAAILYFATYDRYDGPNWIAQYVVLLSVWGLIAAMGWGVGLIGMIALAGATALSVFSAGLRFMTVGLGLTLATLAFGTRWSSGAVKAFGIILNIVFIIWFFIGLAGGDRSPLI